MMRLVLIQIDNKTMDRSRLKSRLRKFSLMKFMMNRRNRSRLKRRDLRN